MNNNLLLEQAIRNNPISLDKKYALLIDDLFGFVSLEVKTDKSVYFTIYTPLNFRSANMIKSHHESHGTFFYHNTTRQLSTYIMLNEEETQLIDEKHDNLRMALGRKVK